MKALSPVQQRKAIAFLRGIVEEADEQAGGYDDHPDILKLRLFLIRVGGMTDRRKK